MKPENLYTLQWREGSHYRIHKWDDGASEPSNSYNMTLPQKQGTTEYSFFSCSCPSRSNPCKHFDIAKALLTAAGPDPVQRLHEFCWEEGALCHTSLA